MNRVIFRLPGDVRARLAVLSALLAVCVYRSAFYVPSPGVNQVMLTRHFAAPNDSTAAMADEVFELFRSGNQGQGSEDAAR